MLATANAYVGNGECLCSPTPHPLSTPPPPQRKHSHTLTCGIRCLSTVMLVFFSGFWAMTTDGYRLLDRMLGPSAAWPLRERFRLRSLFKPVVLAMESVIVSAGVLGLRARLNCGIVPGTLVVLVVGAAVVGVLEALSCGALWSTTLVRSGMGFFVVCGSSKSG